MAIGNMLVSELRERRQNGVEICTLELLQANVELVPVLLLLLGRVAYKRPHDFENPLVLAESQIAPVRILVALGVVAHALELERTQRKLGRLELGQRNGIRAGVSQRVGGLAIYMSRPLQSTGGAERTELVATESRQGRPVRRVLDLPLLLLGVSRKWNEQSVLGE